MTLSLGLGLGLGGQQSAGEIGHNLHSYGVATVSFDVSSAWEANLTAAGVATPSFVSLVTIEGTMTSAGVASVSWSTSEDVTAPILSSALDSINNELDITLTELNFPVTIRWQVRAIGTAAPDQAAMLAGSGAISNGSYSVASTPDSTAINLGALLDQTEYTIYVMASDPTPNHSAIDDTDFTYEAPTSVTVTIAGAATVSFVGERIVVRTFAPAGAASVIFLGSQSATWMTGAYVIDGGAASGTSNDAVDGGTATLTYNDLIGGELAA